MSSRAVYHKKIIDAVATDEATGVLGPGSLDGLFEHTFYVEWGASVSAGEVAIETASHESYTGTWANLATVTYSTGSPHAVVVSITGAYLALRARINTAVTGGTVTVTYVGVS